ncbi:hypothetical protein EC968_003229 [Mortierella alpina]|nr:hypothetical protein EC968_003229 [Mortierella alpina]
METVQALKGALIFHTGSLHTAEFLLAIARPIVLTLNDSSQITVLGTPNLSERLAGRRIVNAKEIQGPTPKVDSTLMKSTKGDLSHLLLAHKYGRIVMDDMDCCEELDDGTCQRRFSEAAQNIARKLAGALIQSKASVLLVLKVEIYGRTRTEDPHEQPLAFPLLGSYIVNCVSHDGAKKILIGTDSWLALITSCVQLDTGNIIVGPHNTHFIPHKHSKVWIRTSDYERNSVVERQLRSKFHESKTYMECAGAASGIKTVSATFSQLYEEKALSQSRLAQLMSVMTNDQARISREIQNLYQMLTAAIKDDSDMVSVSESMSRQLRVLTEFTTSVTTTLNHTVVKESIQQRIEILLNEKA